MEFSSAERAGLMEFYGTHSLFASQMQRAEMEELRQREANLTALQAIGPRKKPRLDSSADHYTYPGQVKHLNNFFIVVIYHVLAVLSCEAN